MIEKKQLLNIPNLTPLRFFLALFVIIFHIHQFCKNRGFPFFDKWAILNKGTECVYVFFVLSGFLIIRGLYLEKKETNKINIKRFYIKRCFRILPLYYLVLIFGFLYYKLILPKLGFETANGHDLFEEILLGITLFANVLATYSPGGILEILWSIAVEEQFYLFIAPALFLIPLKKYIKFLLFFTCVYFLIYFFSSFYFLQSYQMLFFYFTAGGFAGLIIDNSKVKKYILKIRYLIYISVLVLFATNVLNSNFNDAICHFSNTLIISLFILVLALRPFKILETKTFYLLGNISYGMYMLHPICMQIVGFIFLKQWINHGFTNFTFVIVFNALVIMLTIAFSYISNKYFESYFMKLRNKFY